MKIKVKPEGRKDIWIPTSKSNLKKWIRSKKFAQIHNFIPSELFMIGADHSVESVLKDIDKADRFAVFTDISANMGHSLALIHNEKLECYDIGKLTENDLEIIIN